MAGEVVEHCRERGQLGVGSFMNLELCGVSTAGRIGCTAPGAGSPQTLLPAPSHGNGVTGQAGLVVQNCDIWCF